MSWPGHDADAAQLDERHQDAKDRRHLEGNQDRRRQNKGEKEKRDERILRRQIKKQDRQTKKEEHSRQQECGGFTLHLHTCCVYHERTGKSMGNPHPGESRPSPVGRGCV